MGGDGVKETLVRRSYFLFLCGAAALGACATTNDGVRPLGSGGGVTDASTDTGSSGGSGGSGGTGGLATDATLDLNLPTDAQFDPDAACATASEAAEIEFLPVDIIWVVDNSVSMAPAIAEVTAGLNAFVALIAGRSLDYKVIMLSLRSKTNPVQVGGSDRFGVCIPPPLAGDSDCGNGPNFFQSSIDIRSTQPLEQFLGTLGQTNGYRPGDEKGGEPWMQELRPQATKTIVVVSDDNSRLSADQFETFPGGGNPFNSLDLPPGILDSSWNGLFDDYVFDALYGWGSDTNPGVKCTYSGGGSPPSSGATYTELVSRTSGVRAQICDGSSAWGPFFDAVAQAVSQTSKIRCELDIPPPSEGTLDPGKVNVTVNGMNGSTTVLKVAGAAACDSAGGWYYDDDANPTQVILCPASCDAAQAEADVAAGVSVDVHFGCATLVK